KRKRAAKGTPQRRSDARFIADELSLTGYDRDMLKDLAEYPEIWDAHATPLVELAWQARQRRRAEWRRQWCEQVIAAAPEGDRDDLRSALFLATLVYGQPGSPQPGDCISDVATKGLTAVAEAALSALGSPDLRPDADCSRMLEAFRGAGPMPPLRGHDASPV